MEERERERSQRDSFRDFEMLYQQDGSSPSRGSGGGGGNGGGVASGQDPYGGGSTAVGGDSSSKIRDDELKPEVVSAIDLFDAPGRNSRPRNVR